MEESERVLGEGADAADAQHVVVGSAPGRVKDQATLHNISTLLTPHFMAHHANMTWAISDVWTLEAVQH